MGWTDTRPKILGFQAEGAAPIVKGEPVADPVSIASAIRIGNPASWKGALDARDQSGGVIDSVSDAEILEAYRLMARREGIFCEPASAASVALVPADAPFRAGDKVTHDSFGRGIVVSCVPKPDDYEVTVAFVGSKGVKRLLYSIAKLAKVERGAQGVS